MKCPFCNAELIGDKNPACPNVGCCKSAGIKMPEFVWQALIDGKKAQEALNSLYDNLVLDLLEPGLSVNMAMIRTYARLQKYLGKTIEPKDE